MLAEEMVKKPHDLSHAFMIGLVGELGSGKTTFTQGFAQGFGITESVLSPTFVLMRQYPLRKKRFQTLIHIDCYRLNNPRELFALKWQSLRADPRNLILVEWADRIKDILRDCDLIIAFDYGTKTTRVIAINKKECG